MRRSIIVRLCGEYTSDHADMSSDKAGERPARRKTRVYWVKLICSGLGDT